MIRGAIGDHFCLFHDGRSCFVSLRITRCTARLDIVLSNPCRHVSTKDQDPLGQDYSRYYDSSTTITWRLAEFDVWGPTSISIFDPPQSTTFNNLHSRGQA
jgi:hypothetical protein